MGEAVDFGDVDELNVVELASDDEAWLELGEDEAEELRADDVLWVDDELEAEEKLGFADEDELELDVGTTLDLGEE